MVPVFGRVLGQDKLLPRLISLGIICLDQGSGCYFESVRKHLCPCRRCTCAACAACVAHAACVARAASSSPGLVWLGEEGKGA